MQSNALNSTELDLAVNDLGPLAWVLDELRKSLDSAAKALKRFVREAEAARGSDLAALDASQLRIARQQLHQAVGALEMVGLAGPALVLRAMEAAVQKFVQQPEQCSQEAAAKIERASFALTEYLEGVLADKPISAVSLFPQYREVQELVRADRIHPADLWPYVFRWLDPELAVAAAPQNYDADARAAFDQSVLQIMKGKSLQSAENLQTLSLGFAARQADQQPRVFWKIAAAYFDALANDLLGSDLYVRRVASRVLLQYSALSKGDSSVSERLTLDLLFFCSQAEPNSASQAPVLSAVRTAFGLARFKPVDYEAIQFGRFDPALLAQARKRIVSAKESWSSLSAGDTNKFKLVGDQFGLVSDSLVKLHPPSEPLALALARSVDMTVRSGQPPAIELAMEVATSVLYLEAAFEDLDPSDPQLALRTHDLAVRLENVRGGGQPQPLQPWMEELYRRVSDKQTMGSVVGELRIALGELEKSLDLFFRNPREKAVLGNVPGQLSQMRGVLSVLGLDQASQAVLRMRESVEHMLETEVDEHLARAAGTFDQLGNNLGALSFLIDMLNYQPALAKKLFVYDDVKGELRPLMGRAAKVVNSSVAVPAQGPTLSQEMLAVFEGNGAGVTDEKLTFKLDALSTQAALAGQVGLAKTAHDASMALANNNPEATAIALGSLAVTLSPASGVPTSQVEVVDFEEDDLRDIFLEEAREVTAHGQQALEVLANDPGDVGQMTVLRRVFHTLKGSSRMVGLNEFGEAAWSMEQLYNSWLADQKSASDAFRGLSVQALTGFARWIEDIAANHDGLWKASAFRSSADALRGEGELIPLALPAVAAADGTVSIPATPLMPTTDAMPNLMEATSTPVAEYFSTSAASPAGAGNALADTLVASSNTDEDSGRAADELMDFDVFFGIDQVSSEAASAVVAPVDAVVQPAVVAHDSMDGFEIQGIDFESLSALSATLDAALTAEAAAEALEIEALQKQLDSFEIGAPVSDINLQAPPETVDLVELSAADFDAQFSPGLAVAAAESATDAPHAVQGLESAEVHEAEAEEQVKIIGDLRIGIPLYNVYLNEADEWSRRLVTEVAEWAIERHQPVSDSTVSFAHSLAGSSATVGFASLSEMARALEHALQRSQVGFTDQAAKVHARVFVEAAEDIRRLLHQFAAGFLKESNAEVLALLRGLDFTTGAAPLPVEGDDFDFVSDHPKSALVELLEEQPLHMHDEPATEQTIKPYSEPHSQPHSAPYSAPQTDAEAMQMHPSADVEPVFSSGPVASYVKAVTPLAPAPVSFVPSPAYQAFVPAQPVTNAPFVNFVNDADDEFDAVDAIDLELFPIFEEEGAELMPQLGGALRQWSARPNNQSARMEVLRALHTLKGSARLAGAMRLGEMAHKIESEIEYLGSDSASSQEFEPLLARFDAMQTVFERLRKADAAALVNANAGASVNVNAFVAEPVVADPTEFLTEAAAQLPEAGGLDSPVATSLFGAGKVMIPAPQTMAMQPLRQAASASIRVRSQLLDRMVNQAGEVMITRSRLEVELNQLRSSLGDMTDNLNRLRLQLRDIELQAETQMQSRLAQAKELQAGFDPLEFDRFTRVQELTRMMAESVNDVATVQRTLQRTVEATEDDLIAQARQTRELQRDLLRTRMVEFEGISDRLYRVVRQASKETGKQVKLDLLGSTIEMDRGMLDRMTPAFEHLLRNCVAHGIENPEVRLQAGKEASGLITVHLRQEGNDVSVEFSDDGAGLDLQRIREKALSLGLVSSDQLVSDEDAANLIFMPGFSTAAEVTELSGRGIGMDVVRSEVNGVGGRIETTTARGKGTQFKLVLPLTTAVTQVVMVRSGSLSVGVPANVVETVRRTSAKDLQQAYNNGFLDVGGESVPFFWSGALLQASHHTTELQAKTSPVVVFRSASQRIALHVDEVLGNQEVVVKNLGPQLSRLPGLAGMSVLASGAVVLIYNPVALASIYGQAARALSADSAEPHMLEASGQEAPVQALLTPAVPQIPLIMVVDDSITVRRVTQRLLQREGYRVVLASDGLQALERLQEERPSVVLSDIEMPRMDGFDLARNIRADARLSDLPIVMITSRIAEKHRDHAKELGVDHYLGKPYAEEELMTLVRHYCNAEALV